MKLSVVLVLSPGADSAGIAPATVHERQVAQTWAVIGAPRTSLGLPSTRSTTGRGVPVAGAGEATLNRLHLSKYVIAAGSLLTDTDLPVTFWNSSHRHAINVTRVESTDPDAVLLPFARMRLAPGESVQHTIRVRIVGKPQFDDSLRFVAAELGEASPALRLTGSRLVIFPIAPDWQYGIEEELRQDSSVLVSHSGVEQRALLREDPVRTLRFTVAADGENAGKLEAFMWAWQSRSFGVPEWQRAGELTSSAAAGTLTLACDTRFMSLRQGDPVLLYADDRAEVVLVHEATGSTITLVYAATQDYPARSHVVPVSFARMPEQVSITHAAPGFSTAALTFQIEPDDKL